MVQLARSPRSEAPIIPHGTGACAARAPDAAIRTLRRLERWQAMSTNKIREAGKRAFPKDTKPTLRLVRPLSECSTRQRALSMLREVERMQREMNQRLRAVTKTDPPDAA